MKSVIFWSYKLETFYKIEHRILCVIIIQAPNKCQGEICIKFIKTSIKMQKTSEDINLAHMQTEFTFHGAWTSKSNNDTLQQANVRNTTKSQHTIPIL